MRSWSSVEQPWQCSKSSYSYSWSKFVDHMCDALFTGHIKMWSVISCNKHLGHSLYVVDIGWDWGISLYLESLWSIWEPYLHISVYPSYTEHELIPAKQVKGVVWYMFLVAQVFMSLMRVDLFALWFGKEGSDVTVVLNLIVFPANRA